MGVVKEHIIFEKFTEDGDPVADMGIGIKHQIKEFLIQNGENKFIHSDELMLIACCAWNKINWVKYLLDIGTDVNVDTGAPLRYAAFSGYIRLMKLLIDYGADINARSPLGWAIDGKRYEAAKLLLNKGADVHFSEDKALRTAVGHNYVELTRLLLLYGADIHGWHDWILKEKKNCSNQMKKIIDDHLAKEKNTVKENLNEKFTQDSDPIADMNIGMMHEIKLWMKSVNEPFEDKDNALVYSARYGKLDFVEYLLAAGTDVHADNDNALRWASYNGHTEVVKVLLAAGANVHADNDGALRLASDKGHTEVVKVLLAADANVHAGIDYALRWASYYRHTEVVKVLKDHIAKEKRKKVKESLNEKFTQDSDPIEDMGIGIEEKLKKFAKKQNIDNYATSIRTYYDVLLAYAAEYGELELVKYLLKQKNADIHVVDDFPLRYAVMNGHYDIVKYLLNNGKFELRNLYITLEWAKEENHINIIKLIEKYIRRKKVKESVNEKFTEESDPIEDLGIGLKSMIKKWFISNGATEDQYKKYVIINKEGKIDVSIGLTLTRWVTKELPNFIQFEVIHGDFDISHCNLTTLKGCPERVFGNFSCSGNDLTSLKYSPEEVKYTYDCRNNKKQFTTREVKKYCKTLGDMIMV